jgi:hypothetical protein
MATFVFANNASTTLASAASSSATTLILASATNFPSSIPAGQVLAITLNNAATRQVFEICYATAISGTSVTVTRAQEGTSAQNWGIGDFAFCGVTAGMLGNYPQQQTGIVGNSRGLAGSGASGGKTASWTAQELIAETTLGGVPYKGSSLSLSFNGAGTGAGGMDTGSMPISADLSIYAIYNPTTNTWNTLGCAGSTSNGPIYSGSHMPSGYTASTLLWAGVPDGSGDFQHFAQKGRRIYIEDVAVLTAGTSTTSASISLGVIVPAAAVEVWGGASVQTGASLSGSMAGEPVATSVADTGAGYQQVSGPTPPYGGNFQGIPMVTAQTMYYIVASGGSNMNIAINGYVI